VTPLRVARRVLRLSLLRRSLPARLSAAFLALSVSTLLLVTLISYRFAESALRQRLLERLDARVDANSQALDEWVARQGAAVTFASRLPELANLVGVPAWDARSGDRVRQLLSELQGTVISSTSIEVIRAPGGEILVATDTAAEGRFVVDELHYVHGRDSLFVHAIYPSAIDGRPRMTLASPIQREGRTVAVVAAHLDLEQMERVVSRVTVGVPIEAYIVTAVGDFVSAERFGRPEFRRGVHSLGIDRALAGQDGSALYRNFDDIPVLGVWRWLDEHQLAILLESPQAEAFAPARRLLAVGLLVGLLATGLLTFGVVAITRRATSPVLEAAAAAARVAQGDFTAVAPVRSDDEVGMLARAFNAMTARLRTLYDELNDQVDTTRTALHDAQASRALLQDVVDNTTALVCVVGLDHSIRLVNKRFRALLLENGKADGGADGRRLESVLPPAAAKSIGGAMEDARTGDAVVERELELATGTESHTWHAVCFPLRDKDRAPYAIGLIATDLTERARAEEERRHRDASVQQAQKLESLGIMAGGIAHDFNNILGAVLGNTGIALQSLKDPVVVQESLEQIASATRRASDLTRQMLAYAGKASLKREVIDLRPILHEMVALVRAGQSKKVEMLVDPMPEPLWVEADGAQISQVVLNLLTNAAEAIGDDVGSVRIFAEGNAHSVRFTIEDSGSGMNEEVRRRMFEPFFTTKGSGRGLGLSAVRGIIHSAGGELDLLSKERKGTRASVRLPKAGAPVQKRPLTPAIGTAVLRGTALVVDDEAALRRVTRRVLEPMGLVVLEAADGLAAVEIFRNRRDEISVVLLDLTMPGMDGAEVLTVIRNLRPQVPVIIASGYDASDRGSGLPNDGYTHFLQKPFGIEVLSRVVSDLLG
jgi:C4-dicarboxylate-specific signal transduction histidine kinase/CheY-like chemotaxis protein/HAMP domain-containing protein